MLLSSTATIAHYTWGQQRDDVRFSHALVVGRTPESRDEICDLIQHGLRDRRVHELVRYRLEPKDFCEACASQYYYNILPELNRNRESVIGQTLMASERSRNLIAAERSRILLMPWDPVRFRGLLTAHLQWGDISRTSSTCLCNEFGRQCEASPHIVKVEDLPGESELVAFVRLPEVLRGTYSGSYESIPVYVPNNVAPAYPEEDSSEWWDRRIAYREIYLNKMKEERRRAIEIDHLGNSGILGGSGIA